MRLIDADALVKTMDDYVTEHNALRDVERVDGVLIAKSFIDEQTTVDAVPVRAIEQFKWERDTAIQQLEEHGIPFCGKAEDVVRVVRCGECKWWKCADDTEILRYGDCTHPYSAIRKNCLPNETWFCADGERREE